MSPTARTVSVVCNTLDRADSLAELLGALPAQTHEAFEVVVVHGPCRDHTEQVLEPWRDRVKVRRCPEPNLSMSRNIGIAASAGEVVAFIDDDGIPEPTWLEEVAAVYDDPEVGAVGGLVYNHTGHEFQTRFLMSDRLGNTDLFDEPPPGEFCFPGTHRFPSMLGCNSSFRRSALLEVGGFDEEYEYYLDETDVCLRVVDAGWVVRGLDGAPVHHRYLPSGIRTATKVVTDNRAVVKNKVYFSLVNGPGAVTRTEALADCVAFARARRAEMAAQHRAGNIDDDGLEQGLTTVEAGWEAGLRRGLEGRRQLLTAEHLAAEASPFLPFPTRRPAGRLRLCFLTRTLPPGSPGGVGRFMWDLARELAGRGHEVRIVTTGDDHHTVDLVEGVWVHRIVKGGAAPPPAALPDVPDPLWQNAGPVGREVLRIQRERPVDLVLSSIWDVEHAGVMAWTSLPVVCAFTTSFAVVRATQPETVSVGPDVADRIEALERWAIGGAHAFQANGTHVARVVGDAAGEELDPAGLQVVPLGALDRTGGDVPDRSLRDPSGVELLFLGRLEPRKGIDLLLEALPGLLERHPGARCTLVGRDDLPDGRGSTFRAAFSAANPELVGAGRVRFAGELGDDDLAAAVAAADVAVLPSRFESFGLVFVEAMAAGLPVVALAGSGAEEVVEDGVTGLLATPDADGLAGAVDRLVGDATLRRRLGAAGRSRYLERYTVAAMADRFLDLFRSVEVGRPGSPSWDGPAGELAVLADGSSALLVPRGGSCRLPVGEGRTTVVVGCPGASATTVEVLAGDRADRRRVHPGEFAHVVVPGGAAEAEVRHVGGGSAAVAAVVRARGGATRNHAGDGRDEH